MDCPQVCEVFSAAHDGEPVDVTLLSEAKTHVETCAECRRFTALLERLDAAASPRASAELLARLEARTAPVAAELRDATSTVESAEHESTTIPIPHPRRSWAPRFAAFASAAAVLVVALTVGTIALIGNVPRAGTESASTEQLRATETPLVGETYDAGAADTAATAQPEAAAAPAYVTFGEEVWVLVGAAAPAPSALATAGAVTSTLDDGGSGDRPVYFAGADDSTLYARTADGRYLAFERVIRTRGRTEYALVSGSPITAFGMWPTLPDRFDTPTQPDGSPTFRFFGKDDAQFDVYVPPGGRIEDGFALAPGTPVDDPAAGNPNWTWWQRLE